MVIRAAIRRLDRTPIVMMTIASIAVMAAASMIMMMLGVYIRAIQTADESSYERTAARIAGMHIEPYDTEAVPYDQQHSAKSEDPIFHNSLQIYKNHSNDKGLRIYEKRGKMLKSFLLRTVPMIGVEPTRREALAPETSVSTISPHGLQ